MSVRLNGKRKNGKKPAMNSYSLDYVLELPADVSLDDFLDKFVELVESFDGYIGGGVAPYKETKNGERKEKRLQRATNQS